MTSHFGAAPLNLSSVQVPQSDTTAEDFGDEEPTGDMAMTPDQTMPADFSQIAEAIEKQIEENDIEGEVSVEVGESGTVFIRLSDNLLFAGNSSQLNEGALNFLEFLGECFNSVEGDIYRVNCLGHTASIAGNATDDWILSSERSGRVASFFERQSNFPWSKLETTGFGRHYPVADNGTAEGIAKNRRVDIIVISNNSGNLLAAIAEADQIYFPDDSTEFFEGNEEDLPGNQLNSVLPVADGVDTTGLTEDQLAALREAVSDTVEGNGEAANGEAANSGEDTSGG